MKPEPERNEKKKRFPHKIKINFILAFPYRLVLVAKEFWFVLLSSPHNPSSLVLSELTGKPLQAVEWMGGEWKKRGGRKCTFFAHFLRLLLLYTC